MSDYETTQRRRNIIVGIFVIVGLCALIWLIFKFGDLPTIVTKLDSYQVFVQFPTAPGVQRDTPVQFCGYQIGRVTSVKPPKVMEDRNTHKFYHQTLVVLSINKQYKDIPADVEAKLMTRGLGSSYIELKLKRFDVNEPAGPYLIDEKLLQGSTGLTSEFFPEESQEKLSELIDGLKIFISNANAILGDEDNQGNIKATLANLVDASEQATQTIEEFQKFAAAGTSTFKKTDAKMEEVVTAVVDASEQIRELTAAGTSTLKSADAKAEQIVTAMVDTIEQLSEVMTVLRLILEKVNTGQGTAARLINDGRFYENLLENTEQLQTVLQELKSLIDKVHEKGLRSIY